MDKKELDMIANAVLDAVPTDKDKQAVKQILQAAYKIMYGTDKAAAMTDEYIQKADDVQGAIITGTISILNTIYERSNKTMPWGPAIAAGEIIVLEGLARAQEMGKIEVTKEMVGEVTRKFIEQLLEALGVSMDQLVDVVKKAAAVKQQGVGEAL